MRAAADRGPAGHVAAREADCEGTLPVRAAGAGDCRVRHREDGRHGLRQRPPRVRRSGARPVRQSRQCGQGAQQCRYDSFFSFPQPMTERTPVRKAGEAVSRPYRGCRWQYPASAAR